MPSPPAEVVDLPSAEVDAIAAVLAPVLGGTSGWVNLRPEVEVEVPGDEGTEPARERVLAESGGRGVTAGVFNMLLSSRGAVVPMVTVMAPRRAGRPARVGVEHAAGPKAARALADTGLPLPPGWRVVQDHARTGLVLEPAVAEDAEAVVTWVLAAVARLSPFPLTGRWVLERWA